MSSSIGMLPDDDESYVPAQLVEDEMWTNANNEKFEIPLRIPLKDVYVKGIVFMS